MKPNPHWKGGDFAFVKVVSWVPLLKNNILSTKHPWPFFKNSMHVFFCLKPKDHETIACGHNILKTTLTPYPRSNGVNCMIWHFESWKETNHTSCPLFSVVQ
jgi:hypothetical protein